MCVSTNLTNKSVIAKTRYASDMYPQEGAQFMEFLHETEGALSYECPGPLVSAVIPRVHYRWSFLPIMYIYPIYVFAYRTIINIRSLVQNNADMRLVSIGERTYTSL